MRGSETDCNREGKDDGNIKLKKKNDVISILPCIHVQLVA